MKFTLTVVTIVKNEERHIEKFLIHLDFADEIVVVDNGSIDKTFEIAKKYTDKVFYFTENHFGKLKQFAVSKSTCDWILVLDADEYVSAKLKKDIEATLKTNAIYEGYELLRVGYFLGHRLHAKGFYEYKTRLFKRRLGSITQVSVHEEVLVKGKVGILQGELIHYSYRSVWQTLVKFTFYAKLEAPLVYAKGERVSVKKFTLYPLHMFWSIFIEDGGYKDGIWGLGLALCFTYYEFARYYFLLKYQISKSRAYDL